MSSEINPWEKYPVRVLDLESSEAKRLMAEFDAERQEPKRFAELRCRSLPAESPTEEEIRAAGFDPKTMLPLGHAALTPLSPGQKSALARALAQSAENYTIASDGMLMKRSAAETG